MKPSTKLLSLLATYSLSLSAHAATINIANMDADSTSVSGFTVTSSTSGNTITYSFSQTADLDGGTLNDTLSFDLVYEAYTGSTYTSPDVILGTASTPSNNNVNWHNNSFTTGNTLSLAVANISYIDGEGDETIAFDGFTAIQSTNYASAPAGNLDYYVGLLGATTVTGDPTFQADLTSNGTSPSLFFTAAGGPVRLRDVDFQFETVPVAVDGIPEPTRAALLGLAGLAMFLRRRR